MRKKKLYGYFKRQTGEISREETWSWLKMWNFERETESLLIAAQNNAMRINHVKANIDMTQENRKCWLCGDRDETINHVINECCTLAQKEYKTTHDWMGKVIHWELYKKTDHTNKWYMHKSESVLENENNKILWDFEIKAGHLILARRPGQVKISKKREPAELWTFLSRRTIE